MRKFKTFWEKSMLEEKIELVYMSSLFNNNFYS